MEEALSTIVIPAEAGIYLTWILAFASITNKKTSRLVVFEISDLPGHYRNEAKATEVDR
ncbi:hypothetical protein AGMMS49990_03790 [Endomicrobiia bacterium]|nr:hypothetical protein AGMMS49990_03790 [Endomicrobiia bacterium]